MPSLVDKAHETFVITTAVRNKTIILGLKIVVMYVFIRILLGFSIRPDDSLRLIASGAYAGVRRGWVCDARRVGCGSTARHCSNPALGDPCLTLEILHQVHENTQHYCRRGALLCCG